MASFTDESWSSPEADLDAAQFCAVCLIDLNQAGQPKVKSNCKLPLQKSPGAAYNRAAIRNAMSRIAQMTGVPAADQNKAAAKLLSLAQQAGIQTAEKMQSAAMNKAIRKMAGR